MPEIILSEGTNDPPEPLTQFAFTSLSQFSYMSVLLFVRWKDCNLAAPLYVFIIVSYPIHLFSHFIFRVFFPPHFDLLFSIFFKVFRDHFFLAIGGLKT